MVDEAVDLKLVEHLMLVGALEAMADEPLARASLVGPADKDCDFQQLLDEVLVPTLVVGLADSHEVEHDSFADTAACGARKDTAGILADRVACDRMERKVLAVDLVGSLGRIHEEANENQRFPCPGDERPSHLAEELRLPGCEESAQRRLQSVEFGWQLVELSASNLDVVEAQLE